MQPALNTHRETSVSIQANSENGPEFMIHTEVNGIEHNLENHGAQLVSVHISYMEMVESKDSETLGNTSTRESRDTTKETKCKNSKVQKNSTPRTRCHK